MITRYPRANDTNRFPFSFFLQDFLINTLFLFPFSSSFLLFSFLLFDVNQFDFPLFFLSSLRLFLKTVKIEDFSFSLANARNNNKNNNNDNKRRKLSLKISLRNCGGFFFVNPLLRRLPRTNKQENFLTFASFFFFFFTFFLFSHFCQSILSTLFYFTRWQPK